MKLYAFLILFLILNGCSNGIKEKLLEANKYSTTNRYTEAIQIYDQILEIDSINFHALAGRGLMFYNLGDYKRALADYNKALISKPQAFDIYYNRGLTFSALGDKSTAIKDFDFVISNDSNDYMALYHRGYAKMAESKYEDAIQDFDRAIKKHPSDHYYENRGICKFLNKDIEEALSDLSEAIRLNSKNTSALFNRGNIYYSVAKYKEAIVDLEKVVLSNPNDSNAVIWLKKSKEKLTN